MKLAPAGMALVALLITTASAAAGCSATVYFDADYAGPSRSLTGSVLNVGKAWNDKISSIVVHDGHWLFFDDAGFQGESLDLRPGAYAYVGERWNDHISSARCIPNE